LRLMDLYFAKLNTVNGRFNRLVVNVLYRLPFWLWLLAILVLTLIPVVHTQKDVFTVWDKVAHFFMYYVLTVLWMRFSQFFEPPIWRRQNARLAVFLMFWIALLNEVAQFYVPGRFFSWADLLANVIGIVSAAYIFHRSTQFKSSFYKRISFLW
jgi:VanZ family protein